MPKELQSYSEFWDFYVGEHSKPFTRLLHLVGTLLGIALLVFFVVRGQWYFFPLFLLLVMGLHGSPILSLKRIDRRLSSIHYGLSFPISR